VGWRSAATFPAGRRYKSAGNWSPIHKSTVSRKLPTIIPTAVIIAMAVERAPTSTEVRRKEEERLREASSASTPRILPIAREEAEVRTETMLGIAKADAAISRSAARKPR